MKIVYYKSLSSDFEGHTGPLDDSSADMIVEFGNKEDEGHYYWAVSIYEVTQVMINEN